MKEFVSTVFTAAAGSSGKEAAISGWVAVAGVMLTDWLGGWDKAVQVLLYLMAVDYLTGVAGAVKTKTLNSDIMFWGGVRKAVVLFVIGLAALMDEWLQPGVPLFRTAAIYFYAGREGLSVSENLGKLGLPLHPAIKDKLEQLNGGAKDGK
jgi:toxin secretion/phage lysis holin